VVGLAWWIAPAAIVAVAIFTLVIYALASRLQKREPVRESLPAAVASAPLIDRRKTARNVAIGAAGGLAFAIALMVLFGALSGDFHADALVSTLPQVVSFTAFGAVFALFPPLYRGSQGVRELTSGSYLLGKKIRQRVLRRKVIELSDDELRVADEYARQMSSLTKVQIAVFGLIFGLQMLTAAPNLFEPSRFGILTAVSVIFSIFAIGIVTVMFPLNLRNLRRFQAERAAAKAQPDSRSQSEPQI
jgi:hypothetical protein